MTKYIIISQDRHRDDIVYTFEGTFVKAKEIAKKLLFKMRNYEFRESEYIDESYKYYISMLDGDYAVSIYTPVNLTKEDLQ